MAPQTIEASSAELVSPTTTVAQSMPPAATASFDASSVSSTVKFNWRLAQLNTCPQIRSGAASQNFCDESDLTYTCVCPNGTVPDCTAFADTLPYFICEQSYINCVDNNPNDAQKQGTCAANEQCGTRNATAEALNNQVQFGSQAGSQTSSSTSTSSLSSDTSISTSSSTTTTMSPTATSSPPQPQAGLSKGAVAGIAVASLVIGVAIAVLCLWLYRRSRKTRPPKPGGVSVSQVKKIYPDKQELPGSTPSTNVHGHVARKSELITNSNRHELDPTLTTMRSIEGRAELEARSGRHVE